MNKHRTGMGVERDEAIESYISESVYWYLNNANRTPGGMIDVGCNYGFAMKLMRDKGWKVKGFDTDPQFLLPEVNDLIVKWPMELLTNFVLNANFIPNLFFFNHTLEHSKTPWAVLENASSILPKQGDVFIAFPSPNSVEYVAEGHFSLFNSEFMRFMLKKCGFSVIAERTVTLRPEHEECHFIGRVR